MKGNGWLYFSLVSLLVAYFSLAQLFYGNWLGLMVFSAIFIVGGAAIPVVMSKAFKQGY